MKLKIEIDHKGEDYYGIKIDGKYGEVSVKEGNAIKLMIRSIQIVCDNNTFQKE